MVDGGDGGGEVAAVNPKRWIVEDGRDVRRGQDASQ
jgi:hypothetical protein